MSDATADTGGPRPETAAEKRALREALDERRTLDSGLHIIVHHGNEPGVVVADRDQHPSHGSTNDGEPVALIEWHGGDDYAVSTGRGERTGWHLVEEFARDGIESREAAIDAAAGLIAEMEVSDGGRPD